MSDEIFEAEFMAWWEEHGQYCRTGGGDYERTFAFQAWRHLYPKLLQARATLSPAHIEDGEEVEVVAWADPSDLNLMRRHGHTSCVVKAAQDPCCSEPLMTVAQHQRIVAVRASKAAAHVEDEREAFETDLIRRWKSAHPKAFDCSEEGQKCLFDMMLARTENGEYENLVPREAWQAWQSRAALSAPPASVPAELTNVRCMCGDEYPHDSYGAGFIAGSGMCENCRAIRGADRKAMDELKAMSFDELLKLSEGKAPPAAGVPEGISIERDMMGTMHVKVGDFDYVQVRYKHPYTDNASTRQLAERIAALIAAPTPPASEHKAPLFGILAGEPEIIGQRCADGGTCHHRCATECFRKDGCVPLSGSGLRDDWSAPPASEQQRAVMEELLTRVADWCDQQPKHDWYGRTAGDMVRAFMARQPTPAQENDR